MYYVYFIENMWSHNFKVGIAKDPVKRMNEFQTGCDGLLALTFSIGPFDGSKARELEHWCHNRFSYYSCRPGSEWFYRVPDDDKNAVIAQLQRHQMAN